ncbi:EAL domain-containing protein [Sutterella wadsworthensis]|uniref:EAL domain-containing protein n=1 Tax=Sutterella wadsworthensis TaxID=40545 RepID=UPI003A936900
MLEAAASELDRNLLDHALTAHDSPFEYVRFKTRNQVSWTRIDLQTRITPEGKKFVDGSVTWYDAGQIIHDLLPAASPSGQMLRSLQKLFLLSFEHPVFFATIRAETPVKSVRLVDYIAARLRELACCAEVLPGGHFFFEHQCDAEKSSADKDLLTALNAFLKEADPEASIEILESKRSTAASDNSRLSFWRTVADLLDDEVKAGHADGEVTFSDLIILAEACLNDFKAFYLDLQPIISCSDGSYIGGEFLIRLDSDKINFGPDKFIPLFSESNFMSVVDRKVFLMAIGTIREYFKNTKKSFCFNINISPKQSANHQYLHFVKETLRLTPVYNQKLMIEITETNAISQKTGSAFIDGLHAMGIQAAIDDFGTGYNSLETPLSMSFDMVKFSRSLINKALISRRSKNFLSQITKACRTLDAELCAEGIETLEMKDALSPFCFDKFQGYLFARPMPVKDAARLLLTAELKELKEQKQ